MVNVEGCLDCGRQLHELCNECGCCQSESQEFFGGGDATGIPADRGFDSSTNKTQQKLSTGNVVGRPIKESGDVKDKESTGRKRAALLYPLFPDDSCEWQGLANCGGGKHPIIGCFEGKQQHRHHGPDKNTLNNAPGNVHRICDNCHNIWHSQNNKDYDPNIKHSPRPATQEELIDRMMKVRYTVNA